MLHGTTYPRHVLLCDTCDKQQGRKALVEKHGWLLDDAIKWERNPDRTESLNGSGTLTPQAIRSQTMEQVTQRLERKKQYERSRSQRAYAINPLY